MSALLLFSGLAGLVSGCGPKYTYPAATVPESVEKICRKEYQINAQARVVGKTLGALVYVDAILDKTGQMPKDVNEKMGKTMQVLTRVALSTDLPLDFCTVVIRDSVHHNELLVIRSVDDTKRANADAIGIEESINRTLFGQDRYRPGLDAFVLKEVKLETFLADQIVQRIRYNFMKEGTKESKSKRDNEKLETEERTMILADGMFERADGKRTYRFSVLSLRSDDPKKMILGIFKIINDVFAGYHFVDFDQIEIQDYLNRQKLVIDRQTFVDYQNKKLTDEEILDRYLIESQSIQEAFKLFGFSLPSKTGGLGKDPSDASGSVATP